MDKHLEVEAYFDDGTWARHATVELIRPIDRVSVARGRTNEKGRALLPRPSPGQYLVRVNAGAGHVHEELISVPAANSPRAEVSSPTDALAPEASGEAIVLSSGPSYEEKTRFPWWKLLLGLLVLVGLATGTWFILRQRPVHQSTG
ncbi:MAG: hypothetical protein NZM42_13910 [Gemmatales bacterium]|nr:hypothetical protein [Gemmatales bacterium]